MNILFLMNKTKDQISWVSSHDLYWENKMYKRKRSNANMDEDSRHRSCKHLEASMGNSMSACLLFSYKDILFAV